MRKVLRFPKPKEMRHVPKFLCDDGVFRFPDKREVCDLNSKKGRDVYEGRKRNMYLRQNKLCHHQTSEQCKVRRGRWPFAEIVFGHESSKGFGGGTRDDRIVIDGKPHNYALCSFCNILQGSRHIPNAGA